MDNFLAVPELPRGDRRSIVVNWELGLYAQLFPDMFLRARISDDAVWLEKAQKSPWSAPLDIFVLWCRACCRFSISHAHGYVGRVPCSSCRGAKYPESATVFGRIAARLRNFFAIVRTW